MTLRRSLVLGAIAVVAAGLLWTPPATRAATVIHVPGDVATIQAAIDAAAPGDTVLVEAGTYLEHVVLNKVITLESVAGPEATIIDSGFGGFFTVNVSTGATLRGFTIQHGGGGANGAGVIVQSGGALIEGNRIVDNLGCGEGAGIDAVFSDATIKGNYIADNHQACSGGIGGGGIAVRGPGGSVQILDNVIVGNSMASAPGGGISIGGNAAVVSGNVISGNQADEGGGVYVSSAAATLTNNLIVGNKAREGGGVDIAVSSGQPGPTLVNNTIAANTATSGAGLFTRGFVAPTVLRNNVITGDTASATVDCSNVYDPTPPQAFANDAWNARGAAYGGTCAGLAGADGNMAVDPRYIDVAGEDFHLRPDSPLIDTGTNTDAPATDFDGDARPHDGDEDGTATVDPGYDEAIDPLLIDPPSLYVGNVDVTASGRGSVSLGNFGAGQLAITGLTIGGGDAADYSIAEETCTQAPLDAGDTCAVSLAFAPSVLGTRSAVLTISGPGDVGERSVSVAGVGIDPILVLPPSLDFGSVVVSSASQPMSAKLEFYGGPPVTVSSVSLSGPDAADFEVVDESCTATPIASGTECTIDVTFAPSAVGSRTATLTAVGPWPVGTRAVPLTGAGVSPPSGLAWGTTYRAGPAYTWNAGAALARTVHSGTQRLHLAYATDRIGGHWAKDGGPYAGVYYVRSTSGTTWGSPKRLNPSTQHATRLGLAAAGSRVYAVWASQAKLVRYSPKAPRVLYVRVNTSHGASASWRSALRLSSKTGRVDYPTVAAAGDDVYVTWTDSDTGSIRVAASHDRGRTWKAATIAHTSLSSSGGRTGQPYVAVSGATVAVAWLSNSSGAIQGRVSTNRAASWGSAVPVTTESNGHLGVAVRASRVAVVWTTEDDVVVRQRVAGTWGSPVVVDSLPAGTAPEPYAPAVAFQDPNRIAVTWSETTDVAGYGDLRWVESADGGSLWFTPETIGSHTPSSRHANDWPSVLWPSAGTRYVVWNGWTSGTTTYRLYLRKGSGTPVGPTSAASTWLPAATMRSSGGPAPSPGSPGTPGVRGSMRGRAKS